MTPRHQNERLLRFYGWIAGVGTTSGTRLVLGHWPTSPFGSFSDVMVAHPDGRRELLAPSEGIAAFVASTYRFETVTLAEIEVLPAGHADNTAADATGPEPDLWQVNAGPLTWSFQVGSRHLLGWALAPIPLRVATHPAFARLSDPIARVVLPGVRTIGRAVPLGADGAPVPVDGPIRTEWYAGRDLHRIVASTAAWDGADLGALAPVRPAPAFGFSGTPRAPSLTRVVSTVASD